MKKVFARSLFIVVIVLTVRGSVIPCYACTPDVSISKVEDGRSIILNDDEVWKYRYYNGKRQKRLWSNYKKCWISDHWIDV